MELLRATAEREGLMRALMYWSEFEYDEDAKKERLREASEIAEDIEDGATAVECLTKILEVDASDVDAIDHLVRIEGQRGNHERVADLLTRRIDVEMDPDRRVALRKRLAATYAELGRDSDAIDAWRGALDEEPTDLESVAALEALYEKTEQWTEVQELVERRLELAETPEEKISARVRLARLMESQFGHRDDAIEQLRAILEEDPQNREALDELERLYGLAEDWDELVSLLERRVGDAEASGDVEDELAVLARLGTVHVERRHDTESAIAIYERVLARDSNHVPTLSALVALHRERSDWASATDVLERLGAIQEGEDAIATMLSAAELANTELNDPHRAEAALRRVYELDGGTRESRDRLKAHYEAHEMPDKLAMMLALDEEDETDPKAKVALLKRIADLYSGPLSDHASAAQYLERASELDPDDRDVLLPLCDLYIAAGRERDAIPVLEQIVASYGTRRNKEVAVYHHRLGKAKESMGDLDGALASYDAAFKVDLTNVHVLTDLGRLCLSRGDYDRAQKTFRALLLQKLKPDDGIAKADVYYYLGDIASKQGDNRKAISMLERSVAEDSDHADAKALLDQLKG